MPFVHASSRVENECQGTADVIGYAVPCPTVLPLGTTATAPVRGCGFAIIAPTSSPACAGGARLHGWVFGTSGVGPPDSGAAPSQHLAIWANPRVVRDPARAIDGPQVYPERVLPRGTIRIGGILRRWYLVPMDNPSAFRGHLVLLWNESGHTYVYGFHVTDTIAMARALDLELVRRLKMVEPRG